MTGQYAQFGALKDGNLDKSALNELKLYIRAVINNNRYIQTYSHNAFVAVPMLHELVVVPSDCDRQWKYLMDLFFNELVG